MSEPFFFVPTLRAGSTHRTRELQQIDVRRHAAIISHRRKSRPQLLGQAGSLDQASGEVLESDHLAQNEGLSDLVQRLPGSQGRSRPHKDSSQDGDQEIYRSQPKSLSDEPHKLKSAEYLDSDGAFLEAIELQNALAMVRSNLVTRPKYPIAQKSTPSLHRAVEYCAYNFV